MGTRKAIHAYLTNEAHDTWHDFAAENGVSVSGLLEAISADWAERLSNPKPTKETEALIKEARRIDAVRRRRGRNG